MEHHPLYPPSASERWLECTASPLPLTGEPYQGDVTQASAEGSFAHRVFADMVQCGGLVMEFKLGEQYEEQGYTFTYDESMHEYLDDAYRYIRVEEEGLILVEHRVGFTVDNARLLKEERIEGTSDVIQITNGGRRLDVYDLKYGKGVRVGVKENTQLGLYAMGALETLAPMLDYRTEPVEVWLHILQPRIEHFVSWQAPPEWLADLDMRVTKAVLEVQGEGDGPTFRPSEKACRWCPIGNRGECEAEVAFVTGHFDKLTPPDDKGSPSEAATMVRLLEVEDLGLILGVLKWYDRLAKAMRARATSIISEGGEVPGWKLVVGKMGPRKWADEEEAAAELMGLHVQAKKEVMKSPAAIEKEIGGETYRLYNLQGLVTQELGSPSLAPADDPRPALEVDVSFEAVDSGEE